MIASLSQSNFINLAILGIGLFVIYLIVTEVKKLQKQVRTQKNHIKKLKHQVLHGIITNDDSTRVRYRTLGPPLSDDMSNSMTYEPDELSEDNPEQMNDQVDHEQTNPETNPETNHEQTNPETNPETNHEHINVEVNDEQRNDEVNDEQVNVEVNDEQVNVEVNNEMNDMNERIDLNRVDDDSISSDDPNDVPELLKTQSLDDKSESELGMMDSMELSDLDKSPHKVRLRLHLKKDY